jgi:hypothetical protein
MNHETAARCCNDGGDVARDKEPRCGRVETVA